MVRKVTKAKRVGGRAVKVSLARGKKPVAKRGARKVAAPRRAPIAEVSLEEANARVAAASHSMLPDSERKTRLMGTTPGGGFSAPGIKPAIFDGTPDEANDVG